MIKVNSKRVILKERTSLIFLHNLSHYLLLLLMVFQICYNNGLKSIPLYFFIVFLFSHLRNDLKSKSKVVYYFSFIMLFIEMAVQLLNYFANTENLKPFFKNETLVILAGKFIVEDDFDRTKENIN